MNQSDVVYEWANGYGHLEPVGEKEVKDYYACYFPRNLECDKICPALFPSVGELLESITESDIRGVLDKGGAVVLKKIKVLEKVR